MEQSRRDRFHLGALILVTILSGSTAARGAQEPPAPGAAGTAAASLDEALRAFYSARYDAAAALTLDPCVAGFEGLAACEVRTTALLFRIRRAMGDDKDRDRAWKACAACPALMAEFDVALAHGQAAARARLEESPGDDHTLFLLGKLDLNYVWLRLGTLGRRTGWSEYWEARRSLDTVLERQPGHVRARVARGWIDYIVDTRVRRGAKWLLGGGSKKRGLQAIRNAAAIDGDFFQQVEARFALWDIQVRERDMAGAVATAHLLFRDFPDNHELKTFIEQQAQAPAAVASRQRQP